MGKVIHGTAMNCMIVPYDDPDGWFFKQFLTQQQIYDYAAEHRLVVKEPS